MKDKREDVFECRHCRCVLKGYMFNDFGMSVGIARAISFCPNCGKDASDFRNEHLKGKCR